MERRRSARLSNPKPANETPAENTSAGVTKSRKKTSARSKTTPNKSEVRSVKNEVTPTDSVKARNSTAAASNISLPLAKCVVKLVKSDAELVKSEAGTVKNEAATVKSEAGTVKSEAGTVKSEAGTVKGNVLSPTGNTPVFNTNIAPKPNNIVPLPKNLIPLPKNLIPLPKNVIPLSKNIIPLPKNVIPLPKNAIPLPKNAIPLPKNVIPLPRNIAPMPTNIAEKPPQANGLVTNPNLGYKLIQPNPSQFGMGLPFPSQDGIPNSFPLWLPPGLLQASIDQGLYSNPSLIRQALLSHMQNSIPGYMGLPQGTPQFLNKLDKNVPKRNVSQLWMNTQAQIFPTNTEEAADEEYADDDEDLGVAETYADYMPMKLNFGKKHPDPVVETSSLSSVEPTDVWYELSLPKYVIESGALSALQLEAVTYACQQHEHFLPDGSRAGFLIGDGAGVGKGRTIAGIIYENLLKGRDKALWVSVSTDLKYDSERDLRDIGASDIEVHALNKLKYARISSAANGNIKSGVMFSTYSSLIGESSQSSGKYKTRLNQLIDWLGNDFEGPIIFDECHRAKNLCPSGASKPTKTGLTVLEIQKKLPKARVVYSSATGASEPNNMAYMTRLGIFGEGTPFNEFKDFIAAVEKRGVGAMEIVAMDMKLRGMYIARQLSFHGVSFQIHEVHLSPEFIEMYDNSVKLWVKALELFREHEDLIKDNAMLCKAMWGQFFSAHQRFFKYLCIAAKVDTCVNIAKDAVQSGKCVVIGLQSTGEARTLEQLEREDGELTDFVSTAKGVFQTLVEKHFPAPDRNKVDRLLRAMSSPKNSPKKHSNSRKKPVRRAAQRTTARLCASKRSMKEASSEESGDEEDSESDSNSKKKGKKPKIIENDKKNGKRKSVDQKSKDGSSKRAKVSASSDESFSEESDEECNSSVSEFKLSENESEESSSEDSYSSGKESSSCSEESEEDAWIDSDGDYKPFKKVDPVNSKINSFLNSKCRKTKKLLGISDGTTQAPFNVLMGKACNAKEELLKDIDVLGEKLPPNTLDHLIDQLGGPSNVAEMTGRKGRVVQAEEGVKYESRSDGDVALEALNLAEKQRFMDGEKLIAIISEAASSGISLQSDRRAPNKRRRVHITLELPWSADRAIQQFGRTHRSNQVNAPEYIFLISDLAGERRFASIVAKRLESLGALTHGDRRATETRDLSRYNIDNKYGRAALEVTLKVMQGSERPLVPPPEDYKGDFFEDVSTALQGVGLTSQNLMGAVEKDKKSKEHNSMSKFLNRILGMEVELQNRLFKYFTDTLDAIVTQAKKLGRYDLGILDLGTGGENVKRVKLYTFLRKHATGSAMTELHTVQVERGMSWEEALEKSKSLTGSGEGFYLSYQVRNDKQTAILAIATGSSSSSPTKKGAASNKNQLYSIYRPNTGLQLRHEALRELEKKYKKVTEKETEESWKGQYESSLTTCSHAYWSGKCRVVASGMDCEVGLRLRTYNVLSGSVLSVWTRVENVLMEKSSYNAKMQVVRLRTSEGTKIVGTLIPKSCMELLKVALAKDAEKTDEQTF